MGFCTCCDILIRFVFILVVPYLIGTPGLNLGARLGYVMGFIAVCSTIFVFFFVPETKGEIMSTQVLNEKPTDLSRQVARGDGRIVRNEPMAMAMAVGKDDWYRISGRSGRARRIWQGDRQRDRDRTCESSVVNGAIGVNEITIREITLLTLLRMITLGCQMPRLRLPTCGAKYKDKLETPSLEIRDRVCASYRAK